MLILLIMFLTSSRAPWSSRCLPNGLYLNLNFIYLNRRALATSVDDYHQLKCIKHCSIHHRCSTPSFTFHATFCSHSGLFFATVPFSCAAPLSALLLLPAAASPPPQTYACPHGSLRAVVWHWRERWVSTVENEKMPIWSIKNEPVHQIYRLVDIWSFFFIFFQLWRCPFVWWLDISVFPLSWFSITHISFIHRSVFEPLFRKIRQTHVLGSQMPHFLLWN